MSGKCLTQQTESTKISRTSTQQHPRTSLDRRLGILLGAALKEKIFFPRRFSLFRQKAHFPQTPSFFPHMTFQSLGYIMKRAAAFRACSP